MRFAYLHDVLLVVARRSRGSGLRLTALCGCGTFLTKSILL